MDNQHGWFGVTKPFLVMVEEEREGLRFRRDLPVVGLLSRHAIAMIWIPLVCSILVLKRRAIVESEVIELAGADSHWLGVLGRA